MYHEIVPKATHEHLCLKLRLTACWFLNMLLHLQLHTAWGKITERNAALIWLSNSEQR